MNHVIEATDLAGPDVRRLEAAAEPAARRMPLPWDSYLRCFFLTMIIATVGYMAWRPSLLRVSVLLSVFAPSHGDSLAWSPPEETTPLLPPVKHTPPPAEWRLTAVHSTLWQAGRPGADNRAWWLGGRLDGSAWKRMSENPWAWSDDAERRPKRRADLALSPDQQQVSSFRSAPAIAQAAIGQPVTQQPAASLSLPSSGGGETGPFGGLPPLRIPALTPLPDSGTATSSQVISLPENITQERESASLPSVIGEKPSAMQTTVQGGEAAAQPTAATQSVSADAPARTTTSAVTPAPEAVDWKNREISGVIPGSYLTIYPKLRFVGLCVPGQGYVRKYNQVAVPGDLQRPKIAAGDGRTPYGKYYVAGRRRDADGPALMLSWPSPDDARRIGLSPEQIAAIENAWLRQALPAQDSAGGGIALAVIGADEEFTAGGFGLEEPQMEELFTALPDGAWVFVQE